MHQCFGIRTYRIPGKPYPSRETCIVRMRAEYSTTATRMDALSVSAMHDEIDRLNELVKQLTRQISEA